LCQAVKTTQLPVVLDLEHFFLFCLYWTHKSIHIGHCANSM